MAIRTARRQGKNANRTPRKCMCCRNTFMSDGPHNRLCKNCRNDSRSMGPMDEPFRCVTRRR